MEKINEDIQRNAKRLCDQRNREKIAEQRRRWKLKNKDRLKEYWQRYHIKHREKICERSRRYYQNNKEKCRARNRQNYLDNRRHYLALSKKWRIANREARRMHAKNYRFKIKMSLIKAFGGACMCCGESEPAFLTLDHINGGGRKHRLELGPNFQIYKVVRDQGYPKDKYRLLCMNCNLATAGGRTCPHQT